MEPTLLLWDVDGTILRNKGAGKRAMDRAFEEAFGVANAFDGIQMAGGLDLHFIHTAFQNANLPLERLPEFLDAYYPALEAELQTNDTRLMPGVVEILEETEDRPHLYNALGTGNLERGGRIKLENLPQDLNPYFPVGGFCEEACERYQMLKKGIEKAEQHYGVSFAPQNVIIIGDTVKDIAAARSLGARVVAVATGGNAYDVLEAAEPDLLLEDLSDIERFFAFCAGHPTP
ncbi:MAG TPA: HAD family hydrolase [Bacilli bacterium]|nr:HAD family hydrolase [Bacilli bacterium]